ncbi:hypothetical protein QLG13_08205 [Rhodococcus aetherivorans]|uniref:hypothetical protein n=1 Tax=Rhodococcus aetherivorans TaxID=191292 RepID=UPI0012DE1D42|nr:hypothetical protein [Rhodococcus aetherivorans]
MERNKNAEPTAQGRRKFATEFVLGITTHVDLLGRPQDLEGVDLSKIERPSNLYIISRTPVISVHPDSVKMTNDTVTGVVRMQRGDSFDEYNFSSIHHFGSGCSWHSVWPYDEFEIVNGANEVKSLGVVAALSSQATGEWPVQAMKHEVLYVGQAFGKQGERTAFQRLKSHEKLQRILAESKRDEQVWVSLAAITDINLWDETIRADYVRATKEENETHVNEVYNAIVWGGKFKDSDSVSLAEAGLIRYFQPAYNDRLKLNFPSRDQVPLKFLRSLDVHGLMVELQGQDVHAYYGTDRVPFKQIHFAGFEIHVDGDRAGTLTLQSTDNYSGAKKIAQG